MHPNIREYSKNAYASTKELTLSKRSSGATCDLINMLATNKKQSNQSNVIRNMSICVSFWHALLGSLNYTYDSIRTGCDTRGSWKILIFPARKWGWLGWKQAWGPSRPCRWRRSCERLGETNKITVQTRVNTTKDKSNLGIAQWALPVDANLEVRWRQHFHRGSTHPWHRGST